MTGNRLFSTAFARDPKARSLSFFATSDVVAVDAALLDELEATSERNGRCNARICLHTAPQSDFHEMIILERGPHYCRPHRHAGKGESCHLMRGRLAVFVFDDAGAIVNMAVLDRDAAPMFRVGPGRWHAVVPLTDPVLYHEAKPGPFGGVGDSIFADWAPPADTADTTAFLNTLRARAANAAAGT